MKVVVYEFAIRVSLHEGGWTSSAAAELGRRGNASMLALAEHSLPKRVLEARLSLQNPQVAVLLALMDIAKLCLPGKNSEPTLDRKVFDLFGRDAIHFALHSPRPK